MATLRERLAASETDAALRLVAEARPRLFSKVAELRNRHLKNDCELSDLTRDSYSADARRVADAGGDPRDIAGTYASFRKLRAACLWKAKQDLRECLMNADRYRKKKDHGELEALCQYDERLPEIERRIDYLSSLKFDQRLAVRRQSIHKQRHKLGRLPKDWITQIHNQSKDGKYGEAIAIASLIPIRPSEISTRVAVKLEQSGALTFEIRGSKVKSTGSGVASNTNGIGQQLRVITLIEVDPKRKAIFNWLKDRTNQAGGKKWIGSGLSAGGISSAFRAMTARMLPLSKHPPSFYALRHSACATLKASNLTAEQVAIVMGHSSVRSQKAYGTKGQSRGGYKISATCSQPIRASQATQYPQRRLTNQPARRSQPS